MTAWLLILVGLIVLMAGAELLVRGAAWIAEALGVRHMVVGLTVVAIGTSAPELVVSLIAAFDDEKLGLVLGNVYGSNIANLALIMGVAAVIKPVLAGQERIRFELFWLLAATALTLIPFATGSYDRVVGGSMVLLIIVFTYWLVHRERQARPTRMSKPPSDRRPMAVASHIVMVPVGLTGLIFGGDWLVEGAVRIAKELEISEPVIGATILAIGTSLPELATSVLAARKGHPELALGNIIGSNIFNILMVLGVTATVVPLPVTWGEQGLRTTVAAVVTLYMAVLLLGPKRLSRMTGCVLLVGYAGYLTAEVFRT